MKKHRYGRGPRAALLMLLVLEAACVASQAPKVSCDSKLRPINSSAPAKP
ncbi:MAG TPA: hypothetical protein VMF03_21205 [Steroidobacteraceae bacterium]|nr:hypothetical protein [Steroidobacteraceae bacterium]